MQPIPPTEIHSIEAINTEYSLSIIVPVFNEQACLLHFHKTLCDVLRLMPKEMAQIIYVNDGSTDGSWHIIQQLTSPIADVFRINLSRNFGKEAAMTAGLDHASGQAVTILDADLQDPPALLPQMLAKLREGYDVVNMQRRFRQGESFFKRVCATQFYHLFSWLSDVQITPQAGDFRVMSRRVVSAINALPERNRYMKGIMSWPGYRQTTLVFDRPERSAGETKWSFLQLISLALSGITAFSSKPLRFATFAGVLVSLFAFTYGLWVLFKTLFFGDAVAGFPSLMLVVLFLGGAQLLGIGILGEYLSRLFIESKARPVYLIMEKESTSALLSQGKRQNG